MTDPIFPTGAAGREPGTVGPLPGELDTYDGKSFRVEEPDAPSSRRTMISWAITIVVALLLTVVVKTWIFQAYSIPSESMVPTLLVGDRVLVSKLNTDPGRGDIVVFKRPPNDPARSASDPPVLIKRVIGLPGETVTAQDGQVYVNGKRLVEDYLPKVASSRTVIQTPIAVGNDQLLVLGDNRGISFDGRNFGTISKNLIVGRALVRIWPLSRVGSI